MFAHKPALNLLLTMVLMVAMAHLGQRPCRAEGVLLQLNPLSEIDEAAWAAGSGSPPKIVGNRLYIPLGSPGLAIYDISDPSSPTLLARVDKTSLGGQGGAVAVLGDRAFVNLAEKPTIVVLDLEVMPPTNLGECGDIDRIGDLALTGTTLLAHALSSVTYLGGVYAFDTTSQIPIPSGEHLVDLIDPGFLAMEDGTVFLARTPPMSGVAPGIDVIAMADPSTPVFLGHWDSPLRGNVTGIRHAAGRLFLSAYWAGLWVVDASDYSSMSLWTSRDFERPESYALDVEVLLPFVLLVEGGPEQALRKLDVFLLSPDGELQMVDEIPATDASFATTLVKDGSLVILEEVFDNNGDGWTDSKKLRLFRAVSIIFSDGFESGDTSAWSGS